MTDPVLIGFAFSAGLATFFSPCSVGLLPAYVGYFAATGEGVHRRPRDALAAGLRFGLASAAGAVALLLAGGALVFWLRSEFRISSQALAGSLTIVALAVGALLIVLGILLILSRSPSLSLPVRIPEDKSPLGMVTFGALYALASMGCTLPVFFAVMAQAFAAPAIDGLLTFAAFGSGMGTLLLGFAVALSVAKERARATIRAVVPWVKTASGVVLALAGAYVLYYYLVLAPI